LRPLDFASLLSSHEGTHAELARTVEELSIWLQLVEHGLSTALTSGEDPTIHELEESIVDDYDNAVSGAGLEPDVKYRLDYGYRDTRTTATNTSHS